jgi:hypothetical protein
MLLILGATGGYRNQESTVVLDLGLSTGVLANQQRNFAPLKGKRRTVLKALKRLQLGGYRAHFRQLAFGPIAMLMQER